jgi:thiosulfate/3-mercaptopyruvate sulfurtransferase
MNRREQVLISAGELMRLRAAGARPAVLDVRWTLAEPDGAAAYRAGHIPGAVYVSLEDDLSDKRRRGLGRHPLPTGADLQNAARRWGLRRGQQVVVYDDWNRAGSARAWWVLGAAGIERVRILDGGLGAWTAAGGELETGEVRADPGDIRVAHADLERGARAALSADDVAAGVPGTLLDARTGERFRGEREPVDPVAGRIPGARNLPSLAVLAGDGTFRPEPELAGLLAEVGGTGGEGGASGDSTVGVYCGSGITASVVIAALATAGVDAALFNGSWSQWCTEPGRPVATGG